MSVELRMILLSNTLTGKKEELKPLKSGFIQMYACGITPNNFTHLGHGRCFVLFDVLYRFLKFSGLNVTYCRNFTDIDDKMLKRAEEEYGDALRYPEIAERFINSYLDDMEALNCLFPNHQPRATQVIPEIIQFITDLIDKGHAYVVDGDVYFDVRSDKQYGKLSKCNIDDLMSGARVEVNEKKRDPLDFALWKAESKGGFWDSPWGHGRPGWHIECSVMASKYLGETIDIHAGGMDLIFPHHENEIAQSECRSGKSFANAWMHVAFVRVNEEKMSKSLGNFFTLRDIFKDFDPMVVRFYILKHHYRSPLDFTKADLEAAEKAYRKLCKAFTVRACSADLSPDHLEKSSIVQKMKEFISDDLNTAGLWGIVFEHLDSLGEELCTVKAFIQDVLGLTLELLPERIICITPDIQKLIDERSVAREKKDWAKADALRDQLKELGVDVQDKKLFN